MHGEDHGPLQNGRALRVLACSLEDEPQVFIETTVHADSASTVLCVQVVQLDGAVLTRLHLEGHSELLILNEKVPAAVGDGQLGECTPAVGDR